MTLKETLIDSPVKYTCKHVLYCLRGICVTVDYPFINLLMKQKWLLFDCKNFQLEILIITKINTMLA